MRVLALGLIWVVAILGALAALFSAFIGRADFGGGDAARMSVAETSLLVAVAVLVLALAGWLTRRLLR